MRLQRPPDHTDKDSGANIEIEPSGDRSLRTEDLETAASVTTP